MDKCLGTVKLETDRLILRQFKQDDIEFLFKNCFSRKQVTKYVTGEYDSLVEIANTINGGISKYGKPNYCHGCIELKETHESIGSIELRLENGGCEAEIGYRVGDKGGNCGYATEAMKAIVDYGFNQLGIKEISIDHHVENDASGKVALKNGFKFDGVIHNGRKFREGGRDIKKYSISIDEYRRMKNESLEMR